MNYYEFIKNIRIEIELIMKLRIKKIKIVK